MTTQYAALTEPLKQLCNKAGNAILEVYALDDIQVELKADNSPVTTADRRAHRIIADGLEQLSPGVPVLSEEGTLPAFSTRKNWGRYWLVDPLDGTREFIDRTHEFTVNIALIENNQPVLGMVYAPVSQAFYYGGKALHGAWRQLGGESAVAIQTRPCAPVGVLNIALSRHSGRDNLTDLLARFEQRFSEVHQMVVGSSLKTCLVAEGSLDIYPRLWPTSEWDTAAGQAVIEGAGGKILTIINNCLEPLSYNQKESLLNPDFYVIGDPGAEWESLLIQGC